MADTAELTLGQPSAWSSSVRPILLWCAVGLALTMLFFLLTFPFEAMQARLLAQIERGIGAKVQVDQWHVAWPLGLEWKGVHVSGRDDRAFRLARIEAVLSPGDALRGIPVGELSFWLEDKGEPAVLRTRTVFTGWNFQGAALAEGTADRVELAKLIGAPIRGGRLKGRFQFSGNLSTQTGNVAIGDGELTVDATDVAVEPISAQGGRMPDWGLAIVHGKVICATGICRIVELRGNGPDGSVTGSGQVTLAQSLDEARLDLALTITCSPSLSQRMAAVGGFPLPPGTPITVRLVGPIVRPQLSL
jgi:type II secretion system protein N